MRFVVILLAVAIVLCSLIALISAGNRDPRSTQAPRAKLEKNDPADTQVASITADGLEKMNESRARDQKLLVSYEQEQSKLRAEVIKRRRLYQDGDASKAEVLEAERSLVSLLTRIHEMRRSIMESDIAMMEAKISDELQHMPVLGVNGFSETDALSRFNGGARWSLTEASKIEKFFSQNFGRNLPVTAFGQTATHKRMRFDHRDAMDVALHPDSVEGKALINHLRRSGIPFIAFRNAAAGSATGAHIHIGKPSLRTAAQ